MREVAVVGVGMNRWGELWEKSHRRIWTEAALGPSPTRAWTAWTPCTWAA